MNWWGSMSNAKTSRSPQLHNPSIRSLIMIRAVWITIFTVSTATHEAILSLSVARRPYLTITTNIIFARSNWDAAAADELVASRLACNWIIACDALIDDKLLACAEKNTATHFNELICSFRTATTMESLLLMRIKVFITPAVLQLHIFIGHED